MSRRCGHVRVRPWRSSPTACDFINVWLIYPALWPRHVRPKKVELAKKFNNISILLYYTTIFRFHYVSYKLQLTYFIWSNIKKNLFREVYCWVTNNHFNWFLDSKMAQRTTYARIKGLMLRNKKDVISRWELLNKKLNEQKTNKCHMLLKVDLS